MSLRPLGECLDLIACEGYTVDRNIAQKWCSPNNGCVPRLFAQGRNAQLEPVYRLDDVRRLVIDEGVRAGRPRTGQTRPSTYDGIHNRLRALFGSADEHRCVGCSGQAAHWSYNYGAPDELVDSQGLRYSDMIAYYSPRCATCHKGLDSRMRRVMLA